MAVFVQLLALAIYAVVMTGLFLLLRWSVYDLGNYWIPAALFLLAFPLAWFLSDPADHKIYRQTWRRWTSRLSRR